MMLNLMKPRVPKNKMKTLMMLEAFNFQMPRRTWMLVNWPRQVIDEEGDQV